MSTVILDLEADRVLAAEVKASRSGARVVRSFAADIPEGLGDPGRAEDLGAWLRERLDEAGIKAKSAMVAATRAEVLVKRLDAPAGSLSATERHDMVHLQMSRQASLAAGSSVVDYVEGEPEAERELDSKTGAPPLDPADADRAGKRPTEKDTPAPEPTGFVIASAMPAERVETRRTTVRAAGLKLVGIRLRTAGVRALLSDELDSDRPTLLVNPSIGSVELLMLVGGQVVSSRSVAVGLPARGDDPAEFAGRIAVEASRTLVSFRVMEHGGDIERTVVLAGGRVGDAVRDALADRLDLPAETLDPATLVEFDEAVDDRLHPALAPLAGMLLCAPRGIRVHDFANPTRPPDTKAGLRQAALAAVLLLIVVGGLGYVLGQRAIAEAERERARAKEAFEGAARDYYDAQLAGARLGHIAAWTDDSMDWPAHLEHIVAMLPDAESAALGEIGVRLESAARFEPGEQLKDQDAWSAARVMRVSIGGAARDRAHIADLRERLLESGLYTVASQGPEVENRFSMQIATGAASPKPAASQDGAGKDEPAPAGDGDGGDAR